MDVARLRPVEVIAIYKLDHGVAIATDTGDMGYGTDVAIALEDMRQTSPGVIYLDTAEYLLFNSEADGEVVRIRKELKKTIKLCHTTGGIDLGQAVKNLIQADISIKNAKVAILGFTFKENCPDTRNTKIMDIVRELNEYGINPVIADPQADSAEAKSHYGIDFEDISNITGCDAVVLAVGHDEFTNLTQADFDRMFASDDNSKRVLLDIKGILDRKAYEKAGYNYWRL